MIEKTRPEVARNCLTVGEEESLTKFDSEVGKKRAIHPPRLRETKTRSGGWRRGKTNRPYKNQQKSHRILADDVR